MKHSFRKMVPFGNRWHFWPERTRIPTRKCLTNSLITEAINAIQPHRTTKSWPCSIGGPSQRREMKCDGGPSQKKTRQLVGVPYILAQSGEGVSRPLCLCSCWSLALALLPKDIHSLTMLHGHQPAHAIRPRLRHTTLWRHGGIDHMMRHDEKR